MVRAYFPQKSNLSLVTNSNTPPQGLLLAAGAPVGPQKLLMSFPAIADNTFQFYKFYQINPNMIPTTETDLQLPIVDNIPAVNGTPVIQEASGFDIRVFDSSGAAIVYDRVLIEVLGDMSTDIMIWFKAPIVKDLEFFQLTFGKPTATDDANPNSVWSDYTYVAHLNNDPTGGAGAMLDSTASPLNGTAVNSPIQVDGLLHKAIEFDGTEQYIDLGSIALGNKLQMDGDDLSFSFIMKATFAGDNFARIFSKSNQIQGANGYEVLFTTTEEFRITVDGDFTTRSVAGAIPNTTDFFYVVMTKTDGVATGSVFVNGVDKLSGVDNDTAIPSAVTDARLGKWIHTTNRAYEGILEEMTVSAIIPSPDRVLASSNSIIDNDAFWFSTPTLTNGESNFWVDHLGNNITAVGQ